MNVFVHQSLTNSISHLPIQMLYIKGKFGKRLWFVSKYTACALKVLYPVHDHRILCVLSYFVSTSCYNIFLNSRLTRWSPVMASCSLYTPGAKESLLIPKQELDNLLVFERIDAEVGNFCRRHIF